MLIDDTYCEIELDTILRLILESNGRNFETDMRILDLPFEIGHTRMGEGHTSMKGHTQWVYAYDTCHVP